MNINNAAREDKLLTLSCSTFRISFHIYKVDEDRKIIMMMSSLNGSERHSQALFFLYFENQNGLLPLLILTLQRGVHSFHFIVNLTD